VRDRRKAISLSSLTPRLRPGLERISAALQIPMIAATRQTFGLVGCPAPAWREAGTRYFSPIQNGSAPRWSAGQPLP
jgi:hypothetical protein